MSVPASQSDELARRVERERQSNDVDDVLGRSKGLKNRFPHVWRTTERVRMAERALLDDLAGKRVLDYGCGVGDFAVELLARGARVDGIDIAASYVEESRRTAEAGGFPADRYAFHVMDGHALTFADETFDLVIGNGILHHLDCAIALDEIHRVLKPGGRAIFQEPLAGSPLMALFRRATPSARTPDERPFSEADLRQLERNWQVESRYFGMLTAPVAMATSLVLRPWPANPILRLAEAAENLVSRGGPLRSWHQYVLFNLVKPKAA